MWKCDQQEPFGDDVADANPSGLGAFDLPLRLPGQYFDKETNLHNNHFRDFDPGVGRYAESDPLGVNTSLATYGYVDADPLRYSDVLGLLKREKTHDFQLWEGSFNLGSQKAKTKRKGHWEIYATMPDCFAELGEHVDKYDVEASARPSPSIGGKSPMTTIFWQWVEHTEYLWGPRPGDPCCKGSQAFSDYTYDDGGGFPNFFQDLINILQGIDVPKTGTTIPGRRPGGRN